MQAHLEQVLTGLQSVAAAQKEKTKFSEILQPFMKEMSNVLTKVKTDSKLSKQQKWDMLQNAQKGVSGLAKQVAASLDKKSGAKPGTSAKFLSKGQAVDKIVAKLQSSVDKMDKHMKLAEKEHKEGMARVKELVKNDESKAR